MLEAIDYNSQKYAHSQYLSSWLERCIFAVLRKYLVLRPGDAVLEVGCNRGGMVRLMQEFGADACGVDLNQEAILNGVAENLYVMDATSLNFPNESFDKIYSLHTLEHVPDVRAALLEMERVLRPRGKIVLTYPIEPGFLRGFSCIHHAIALYGHLLAARKLHIHSLSPGKIKKLIEGSRLVYKQTRFFTIPLYPHQYFTVLEKQ